MKQKKVILFEMNEVPYRIIDRFVEKYPSSTLKKILDKSKQFNTVCEDQIELDPWISWPTLHRGVIDQDHKILHLGQSLEVADLQYPSIWNILSQKNISVGVFGSLHTSAVPKDLSKYKFYVPDFFSNEVFSYPQSLESFQRFNLIMTRRSARNVDSRIPLSDTLDFLARYIRSGMSLSTLQSIFSALFDELRRPHLKCRRRSLQPLVGLDIFLNLMKTSQPDFSTFYTNHVAAAMHRFWAAAFPDDVNDNAMPADWCSKYVEEIDFSMKILDRLLERLQNFVDERKDTILVIASSIGQQAVRAETTKGFTTITNLKQFMSALGLGADDWEERHTMVPCISVIVEPSKAEAFEQKLNSISVGGNKMTKNEKEIPPLSYDIKDGKSFQIYIYFEGGLNNTEVIKFENKIVTSEFLGFGFFVHQEEVSCSGRHTPFGSLIIYDPSQNTASTERSLISTLDIAPAILKNFNLDIPPYMNQVNSDLLDVARLSSQTNLKVTGGGVEKTVVRVG
jgi:hypothetical protein